MEVALVVGIPFVVGAAILGVPALLIERWRVSRWLRLSLLVAGTVAFLAVAITGIDETDADGMSTRLIVAVPLAGAAVVWGLLSARRLSRALRGW